MASVGPTATTDAAGPAIILAIANDRNNLIAGIDNDDTVTISFSENTNQPVVNAANIDAALALNNSHSWLDGSGGITSATWTSAKTVLVTLSTGTSLPNVAVADTITLDGTTITDGTNNGSTAAFSDITGSFDPESSGLPKGSGNYLQNTGTQVNGDRDGINVIFFEVPDSVSATLYFAINDAGTDGVSPDAGNTLTTDFYLVGGSGTLGDSGSRLIDYSGSPTLARTGTTLDQFQSTTETGWTYFSGVSPSQGEYLGNKYFFKIVVDVADADGDKNAYQVDISYSNSGNPTGVDGVRSFAYRADA